MTTPCNFWLTALLIPCLAFALGCPSGGGDGGGGDGGGGTGTGGGSGTGSGSGGAGGGSKTNGDEEAVSTEGWGNLTGTFTLTGAPAPQVIEVTKDVDFCGKFKLVDESVVVNSENNGLANVVVFLLVQRGEKPPTPHESYDDAAETTVLDNNMCRFEPRVAMGTTTQKLIVKNSDTVAHNTKIDALNQNPILPPNETVDMDLRGETRLPAPVSCSIHPWMTAWLIVKDSPYMAVSDKDGKFEIKNLPAGKWTFQVWHEKAGFVQAAGDRGRVEVVIKDGETHDLGEVKLTYAEINK